MKPWAYYNEIEPYAAQWLRNLIAAGHIAAGEVDERDIKLVEPDDLRDFAQCHFFAGIGGWSLALRLAGWSDEAPVWTGSCPCQPFSIAGLSVGLADERHLWPYWFHLIEQRRPSVVFGEQVEAAIRHGWLDLVQDDMEGIGYAFAPVGLPAAGVGAFHIRQRLWFVAHSSSQGLEVERVEQAWRQRAALERGSEACTLADHHHHHGREGQQGAGVWGSAVHDADGRGEGFVGDTDSERDDPQRGVSEGPAVERAGSLDAWRDLDWIECSDGKARPTQPGLFPLAHGIPNRVGRLRAYGNAIVPQVAAEVIRAFMECRP